MGFDQYHEPPDELPPATRTFARLCASLMRDAQGEEEGSPATARWGSGA